MTTNLYGALFMTLSMLGYAFGDVLMKYSGLTLPLFQSIFLRGVFAVAILLIVAIFKQELFVLIKINQLKFLFLRVIGDIFATIFFLSAIFNMKLANATAILQSLPLAITLVAALFLKDKVGWRRWSAIIIGFIGMLIIIRPTSSGFNQFSFFAITSVAFIVLRDISTRNLSEKIPSIFIVLMTAIGVTFSALIGMYFQGYASSSYQQVSILGCAAIFSIFGILFNVMSMRIGEISFVAPFRYSILLAAILFGNIFFNEYPDNYTLLGSAIIISTGLYTLHREKINKNV